MGKKIINARIDRVRPLTDTVLQVSLLPDKYVDYQAGQYLQVACKGELLSYSIANAPLGSHKYEMHIRHSKDNLANISLINQIKQKGNLKVHLPFGECTLDKIPQDLPLIFIAGGIGFAPIKAMIEQLLADGSTRPFVFYWFARNQSDLYMDSMLMDWQKHVSHFRYFPIITDSRSTKIFDFLKQHFQQGFNDNQFVISGPFDMVFSLSDYLIEQGVSREAIFSDAFSFQSKE